MTTLEKLVRPFQIGDVFTRAQLPLPPFGPTVVVPPDVMTVWEGAADTDVVDEGETWYVAFQSDLKEDKTQRKSKTVKIVNPDDPEDGNKLFVERIDKTTLKTKEGKELKVEMDWSNPKDQAV